MSVSAVLYYRRKSFTLSPEKYYIIAAEKVLPYQRKSIILGSWENGRQLYFLFNCMKRVIAIVIVTGGNVDSHNFENSHEILT